MFMIRISNFLFFPRQSTTTTEMWFFGDESDKVISNFAIPYKIDACSWRSTLRLLMFAVSLLNIDSKKQH